MRPEGGCTTYWSPSESAPRLGTSAFPLSVLAVSYGHDAMAQGPLSWKLTCLTVANSGQMEPLGDR